MLGALLGQALDRRLQLHSWADLLERLGARQVLRNDELLFVLLGRLAKSGGQVLDPHIAQARQEMRQLDMAPAAQSVRLPPSTAASRVVIRYAVILNGSRLSPMQQKGYCALVGG